MTVGNRARPDSNNKWSAFGISTTDGLTPVPLMVDPSTGALQVSGSSGGGPATITDGSDVAEGATSDAAVTAGSAGTISGKLRTLSADISTIRSTGIPVTSLPANASVNVAQINGVTPLMGAGATGTGAQRVVEANGAGKTLLSAGGSVASSGNNTLVAAGTNRLKLYAFSLTTTSATAVTCIFQSGASGTELWRVLLQAPTSVNVGANLAVTPPAWLFATASATLLNLNLSAAVTVHWSAAYYDEA